MLLLCPNRGIIPIHQGCILRTSRSPSLDAPRENQGNPQTSRLHEYLDPQMTLNADQYSRFKISLSYVSSKAHHNTKSHISRCCSTQENIMLGSWGINSELASSKTLGSSLPFDKSAQEDVAFFEQFVPHSPCDASQQVQSLCLLVYPLGSIAIALLVIWRVPRPLVRDMQHAMEARLTLCQEKFRA